MTDFVIGFEATGRLLLRVVGGLSAVLLLLVAVLLTLCVAGLLFDMLTNALAQKWEKSGHVPRNKLERIILENPKRLGR